MAYFHAENNLKQADVIEGATVLPNPNGSAPGQWLDIIFEGYRKLILLLPGPPSECKPPVRCEGLPRLRAAAPKRYIAKRTLKAAMIPESQADKLLAPNLHRLQGCGNHHPGPCRRHPTDLAVHQGEPRGRRAGASTNSAAAWKRRWKTGSTPLPASPLEQIVLYYLGFRQATLAVAESCTGGMISERITSVSGSSRSFLGGAVVYFE